MARYIFNIMLKTDRIYWTKTQANTGQNPKHRRKKQQSSKTILEKQELCSAIYLHVLAEGYEVHDEGEKTFEIEIRTQ